MLRKAVEVTVVVLKIGAVLTPFLERFAKTLPKNPSKGLPS